MKRFLPQAILLDFYGTVVEEDDAYILKVCQEIAEASSATVTAAEVGSYWSRLFSQMCAESFGASFRSQKELEHLSLKQVLEHFKANLDSDRLSQIIIAYWSKPALFPDSKAVLAECRIPICLVSNIDKAELQSALSHHNLSFNWITTSEDCRAYKPRREMFDKALSLLGLPAEKVLHVGDSYGSDIQGAKSLKIPALWINRKNRRVPQPENIPDYMSADLTGILRFLGK